MQSMISHDEEKNYENNLDHYDYYYCNLCISLFFFFNEHITLHFIKRQNSVLFSAAIIMVP